MRPSELFLPISLDARFNFANYSGVRTQALLVVSGAGHQDLYRLVGVEYEQRVLDFFSHCLNHKPGTGIAAN